MAKKKKDIVEQLQTAPIVTTCCNRLGVSRATYYRWKNEDREFTDLANDAIEKGKESACDLAKARLIQAVDSGNLQAIKFLLSNWDKDFKKSEKTSDPEEVKRASIHDLVMFVEEQDAKRKSLSKS